MVTMCLIHCSCGRTGESFVLYFVVVVVVMEIPVINFRDKTRRVRLFHLGYNP